MVHAVSTNYDSIFVTYVCKLRMADTGIQLLLMGLDKPFYLYFMSCTNFWALDLLSNGTVNLLCVFRGYWQYKEYTLYLSPIGSGMCMQHKFSQTDKYNW